MYLRTKTRTNKSRKSYTYAYLVKIKQYKHHPRQKIVKYLGRAYTFPKKENPGREIPQGTTVRETLVSLLKIELKNHYFIEKAQNILQNGDIEVDVNKQTIINKQTGKKACIQMNQGILCEETLKKVVLYQTPKEGMKKVSKHFAKTIVEAGIQAPEASIIEVFKQIQTMINNPQQ